MNLAAVARAFRAVIGASRIAEAIESQMPVGVRRRQLRVETLLVGMMLCQADGRPAHLVRVLAALHQLPGEAAGELGVTVTWRSGEHRLTYRQLEYTLRVVKGALGEGSPHGTPSQLLQEIVDGLPEASVPDEWADASSSYAVDWSDIETFSLPPSHKGGRCADMEASWGHRRGDGPGETDELFFGYYFQLATMVRDDDGPEVPELVRRMCLASCSANPPALMAPVLAAMAGSGVAVRDVLSDTGYSHKVPPNWAAPLRAAGAGLVQDLHPSDRGMKGTHEGAIVCNGNLYWYGTACQPPLPTCI